MSFQISSAPSGTPLADVINSINNCDCPDINICPPDEDQSPSILDNENSFIPDTHSATHLSPAAATTLGATRRQNVHTYADDPRRASVDLQSSFSLHIQSTDMSFDLLNDRISFFGQQQENSYEDDTLDFGKDLAALQQAAESSSNPEALSADEDTFDFAKEAKKMEALAEQYGTIHEEQLKAAEEAAEAAVISEWSCRYWS